MLKSKALAEDIVRGSGIPYTIIRLTEVFGNNDHFTTQIQAAVQHSPLIMPIPGDGKVNLQPLWIEDLLTCLMLIYEDGLFDNRTYELGWGGVLQLQQLVKIDDEAYAQEQAGPYRSHRHTCACTTCGSNNTRIAFLYPPCGWICWRLTAPAR